MISGALHITNQTSEMTGRIIPDMIWYLTAVFWVLKNALRLYRNVQDNINIIKKTDKFGFFYFMQYFDF